MSDTANSTEKPEIMGKCFIEGCTCGGVVGKDPIDLAEPPDKPGMVFYQGKWISPADPPPTVRDEWAMACPKCGDDKQIDVLASAYVRLTPDDPDIDASHDGEHAWSVTSATKCCACGHTGIAREFTTVEPEEESPDV